ncbi:hypothetical protein [Actinoplanes couchii]|uniref:Secreted protein n=1 Tax=Actinoplanes couchii TaxID=403638 RepID=A0ABQ3XQW8_9ACTN|nr:hypothetical protein [Actinoplanes couchii]MDR6318829.1 hypothetical protein [Actinoplanes couchii]GID60860.1 hypothetical protein Aco03nite_092640 [Actinoplanes couchii]
MRRLVLPVLLALAVAGCESEGSETGEDGDEAEVAPCSSAVAADAAVLAGNAVLAEHPAAAELVDQAPTCDDLDEPAGNVYSLDLSRTPRVQESCSDPVTPGR